jgi:hypothetical protein
MRIKVKAKNLYLIYYAGLQQIEKIMSENDEGEDTILGVDIEDYCKGFKKQLEKDLLGDESIMETKINKEKAGKYFIETGKVPPGLEMIIDADDVELEKEE